MTYAGLLDKIYGCWLGKSISGTIGAPYEGYKGIMQVEYDPRMIENMLPNDDLDLQVLWLDVVEQIGPGFTSRDLADRFHSCCSYAPGEYATFRRNYEMGIFPPLSGKFNNNFYIEGMGCPIRSEIWACLAAGDPVLAAELASRDGCLDHFGNSIYAEQHLAALEAMAFTWEGSVRDLIEESLMVIPHDCKYAGLVRDVLDWYDEGFTWRQIFGRVLRGYGHPDCTNMYQNMGVTFLALLCGEGDFLATTILALNCGFDTDCTCATVGSVLGILRGGKSLMEQYNFPEQFYKLGVKSDRRSDRIWDLAEDTAAASLLFAAENNQLILTDVPEDVPMPIPGPGRPVRIAAEYPEDDPTIDHLSSRTVRLHIWANRPGRLTFSSDTLELNLTEMTFAGGQFTVDLTADIPFDADKLHTTNLVKLEFVFDDETCFEDVVGFVGAYAWKLYGPFWRNVYPADPPAALESYYGKIRAEGITTAAQTATVTRQFHLNMHDRFDEEILEAHLLNQEELPEDLQNLPETEGEPVLVRTDRFNMGDVMGFAGPCTIYLTRDIWSPDEQKVCLQIGHSDRFRLWLDGQLLASADATESWTPENIHVFPLTLKAGVNRLVLKLNRSTNAASDFSVMFTTGGACTPQLANMASML